MLLPSGGTSPGEGVSAVCQLSDSLPAPPFPGIPGEVWLTLGYGVAHGACSSCVEWDPLWRVAG